MAWERIPRGAEWQEICNEESPTIQNRKLRNYICDLEDKVLEHKRKQTEEEELQKDINDLISKILKSRIFKEYMRKHDNEIYSRANNQEYNFNGGS